MYETVFVISWKPEWWLFLFLVFGIITFLWACIEYNRYRKGEKTRISIFKCHSIIPTLFASFIFLTCVLCNILYLTSWYKLNSAYRNGSYDITEGKVFVYHEQPEGGHAKGDRIKVGDEKFTIDYFEITNAYQQTISHGGVLKDGVYARVYYYKGKILRIDIKKEENNS